MKKPLELTLAYIINKIYTKMAKVWIVLEMTAALRDILSAKKCRLMTLETKQIRKNEK